MNLKSNPIKLKEFFEHETKNRLFKRYLLVLTVLIFYVAFISFRYNFSDGLIVGIITWSLFVLGTPIADAGILLDLPIRLITKIRMVYAELVVWIIAISTNIVVLKLNPEIYQINELTRILKYLLTHPWPGYLLIFLCFLGTFITIILGDELLDIKQHKDKKIFKKYRRPIVYTMAVVFFAMVFVAYLYIENSMGINLI